MARVMGADTRSEADGRPLRAIQHPARPGPRRISSDRIGSVRTETSGQRIELFHEVVVIGTSDRSGPLKVVGSPLLVGSWLAASCTRNRFGDGFVTHEPITSRR